MLQVDESSELDNLEIFERTGGANGGTDPQNGAPRPSVIARIREDPRLWQGKLAPAFWTITGSLSLAVNMALLIVLILVARQLFVIKAVVSSQLVDGLHENFVAMDASVITTTVMVNDTIVVDDNILVNDTIPVQFSLALEQKTNVEITEDTYVPNTIVYLNGAPILTPITLPEGTILPVFLNMDIPVDQTIPISLTVPILLSVPVNLSVPVSIALDGTEMGVPLRGLQGVVSPYQALLAKTPDSWCDVGWLACWLLGGD